MKTIARPVNPYAEYLQPVRPGEIDRDPNWLIWEHCRDAMDEYYRKVLSEVSALLILAGGELVGWMDGGRGSPYQALFCIREAKDIMSQVNQKEDR